MIHTRLFQCVKLINLNDDDDDDDDINYDDDDVRANQKAMKLYRSYVQSPNQHLTSKKRQTPNRTALNTFTSIIYLIN